MFKKKKKKKNKKYYNETSLAVNNTANVSVVNNYFTKPSYDRKGNKNKTNFPKFIKLCKLDQHSLKNMLIKKLSKMGYSVIYGDGYIYAKGDIPVLLTAHMDTVHKVNVIDFYEYYDEENERHIISSPQGIGGDDRCGIYMILEIIKTHKCSVLFCEDEEVGGIGSEKFCKTEYIVELSDMKYLIELDRANATDAVFYNCYNELFIDFIESNTGYKDSWGTFSDISNLAPECEVAAVNLSCGYYNAHKTNEYVVIEEMLNTIEVVKKLLDVECEQFIYVEDMFNVGGNEHIKCNYNSSDNSSDNKYKDNFDELFDKLFNKCGKESNDKKDPEDEEAMKSLKIMLDGLEDEFYISNGTSVNDALCKFFIENPDLCFNDIVSYNFYEAKVYEEGWHFN